MALDFHFAIGSKDNATSCFKLTTYRAINHVILAQVIMFCKLPDPTKSREERNAYIKRVLPFAVMSNLVSASTQYGFNVWLLPVSLALYGPDAIYSMRNSVVLLSFSSQMIMGALIMETMPAKLMSIPTHVACAVSAILYPLGVVLSGVSLQYSTGRWAEVGLFLSQFLFCGTGLAVSWFSSQVKTVMWFREIGRPSVGAGMFGFFNGLWPMTFSYWGTALVKDLRDIHLSFYYTAAVLFVVSLPSVFLMHSPDEVPLMTNADENTDASENTDHSTNVVAPPAAAESDVERGGDSQEEEETSATKSNENAEITSPLLARESNKISESKTGLTEVASPLLPKAEFNRHPQAYIQSLVWFLTFIPGFSIKFTIAPVMSAVFGASLRMQIAASFIFLGCYALARLLIGLVIGSRVKVKTVARTATFIIPICFFFAGTIVKAWMWVFIVANVGVSSSHNVASSS